VSFLNEHKSQCCDTKINDMITKWLDCSFWCGRIWVFRVSMTLCNGTTVLKITLLSTRINLGWWFSHIPTECFPTFWWWWTAKPHASKKQHMHTYASMACFVPVYQSKYLKKIPELKQPKTKPELHCALMSAARNSKATALRITSSKLGVAQSQRQPSLVESNQWN